MIYVELLKKIFGFPTWFSSVLPCSLSGVHSFVKVNHYELSRFQMSIVELIEGPSKTDPELMDKYQHWNKGRRVEHWTSTHAA